MTYKSNRDWIMNSIMIGAWLIGILILIYVYTSDSSTPLMTVGFGPLLIIGLVFITASMSMSYELQEEGLQVSAGFFGHFFPYDTMSSIHPAKGFTPGGVRVMMSTKGIAIKDTDGNPIVKISPEREQEFRTALANKAPHIEAKNEAV